MFFVPESKKISKQGGAKRFIYLLNASYVLEYNQAI